MAKVIITPTTSFAVNENLQRLADEFENTVSRDGTAPNNMQADLDLDGNDILNVDNVHVNTLVLGGQVVSPADLVVLPPDVMIKSVYDPAGVEGEVLFKSIYDPQDIGDDAFDRKNWGEFDTRAQVQAASIKVSTNFIHINGYTLVGDGGGADYKRVVGEPTHAGKVQSLDGAWWELVESTVTPAMFGAKGDGVTDDTTALSATLAIGRPVNFGGADRVYSITSGLSITAVRSVAWRADGATIKLESPSSIQRALFVELAGFDFLLSGKLTLDCNEKAFSGLVIENTGVVRSSISVNGISVKNCFRASTAFTGGDGIFVRGLFSKILIDDVAVTRVHMAAGAGVPGSQGISGISVVRNNSTLDDSELTIISNFKIDAIFSDDVAYLLDQDGIKVFTSYNTVSAIPRDTAVFITNGRIKNSHGRAIKIQSEASSISDVFISRDATIYGSGFIGNPDIDFQVGGGMVSNVQCHYQSNFPSRVIHASLTQDDARANPTAVDVSGLVVTQLGTGAGIDRVMAVSSDFDTFASVRMHGVHLYGSKTPAYFLTLQSLVTATEFIVSLNSILGRASTAYVYRLGSVVAPCFITGSSIGNMGASVAFAATATAGSFNSSLVGQNRLVT